MATISFTTTFDLTSTPKQFKFLDTSDWAGQSIPLADVNGCFTIIAPSGTTIYSNTDFSNIGCDIFISNSLQNQTTIQLPLAANGFPELGTYTIIYDVFNSVTNDYSTLTSTYTYSYVSPEVEIQQTVDCNSPLFVSEDITNYVVGGITPTIDRTHTVNFPFGSAGEGNPLIGTTIVISTSTFYNGTQTTEIESNLTYINSDGLIILDSISGVKEVLVDCTDTCAIYCCIRSLEQQMMSFQTTNMVEYNRLKALFSQVMGLAAMIQLAIRCGKSNDINGLLSTIKTLANCTDDCSCSDGEPTQVVGIGTLVGSIVVESGGEPVVVTSVIVGNTTTYTVTLTNEFVDKVNDFLNTNIVVGDHLNVSSATVGLLKTFTLNTETTPILYEDLVVLRDTSEMTPGFYLITDYATSSYIPHAGETFTEIVEPLIVQAVDSSQLASRAYSTIYPNDIIEYTLDNNVLQGNTMGCILYRKDVVYGLEANYDWRGVKLRRWETAPASGVFTVFTDNGGAYEDYYTFQNLREPTNCRYISVKDSTYYGNIPNVLFGSVNRWISIDVEAADINFGDSVFAVNFGKAVQGISCKSDLYGIILSDGCNTITIGEANERVVVGIGSNGLDFGNNCEDIVLGSNNSSFVIGNSSVNIRSGNNNSGFSVGTNCSVVEIGDSNTSISIGNNGENIVIGSFNGSLQFGNANSYLSVGDGCSIFIFGTDNSYMNIGNGNTSLTFGNNISNINMGYRNADITIPTDSIDISIGNLNSVFTLTSNSNDIKIGNNNSDLTFAGQVVEIKNQCSSITITNAETVSIGSFCVNFTIGNTFQNNIIKDNVSELTIGNTCTNNVIYDSCSNIVFGNGCSNIYVKQSCSNITLGLDCLNLDFDQSCTFITLGETCTDMIFGTNCSSLTFTDGAYKNYFASYISGIDFTGATHVYNGYDCNIFTRDGGGQRLSYFSATDVLTVVAPTA